MHEYIVSTTAETRATTLKLRVHVFASTINLTVQQHPLQASHEVFHFAQHCDIGSSTRNKQICMTSQTFAEVTGPMVIRALRLYVVGNISGNGDGQNQSCAYPKRP